MTPWGDDLIRDDELDGDLQAATRLVLEVREDAAGFNGFNHATN
jgi:hypothetical protein